MTYKDCEIVLSYSATVFYELTEEGGQGKQLENIKYNQNSHWEEPYYAVIMDGESVQQTFDTLEEAKEYIEEEA